MQANSYDSPGDTGGNREDLRDVLTILEPEDTPYTSMVKKGPAPKSTFIEVLADTLRAPRKSGTPEGRDAGLGNNKATKRQRFGTYLHRAMDEYAVSDVQQGISEKGGAAAIDDEFGNSKAKTIREVKRDLEAVNCSDQEHQGGSEADMITRGAFNWLKTTAQTTNPVPADFRALSASAKTGVGTSSPLFTEAEFNTILKSLFGVYGGKRSYDCIAGQTVIETVDNFTRTQPSSTNQRYYVTENASKHEITLMVQVFESSFGRVNMIPTMFNKVDSAGAGDPTAALILNMDLWELEFFDALHSRDLDDEGGGPRGYVKTLWANLCKNPKGNGFIYNT